MPPSPLAEGPARPGRTAVLRSFLCASTSRSLREWHGSQGSDFNAMASALMALVARLSGISHPLLGTVASGRAACGLQGLAGYLARSHALHAPLDAQTSLRDLAAALDIQRRDMLGERTPELATLARHPQGAGIAARVRMVYVHQNLPRLALPAGLRLLDEGAHRGLARAQLYLASQWRNDRLQLDWEFDSARLDAQQVADLAELLDHALGHWLAQPDQPLAALNLMSPRQTGARQVCQGLARPLTGGQDVVRRFERCAREHAQRTALSDARERLSYAELGRRVDALCWRLQERGMAAGARVGLLAARGNDHVVGLLALFKLGLVAVPMDPAMPIERMQRMLARSGTALLLVSAAQGHPRPPAVPSLAFHGPALGESPPHAGRERRGEDPAYLIFTSGSTGEPKGVAVTHGGLVNLTDWVMQAFDYRPGESICQFAPFSFDVSMAEVLPSLCAGLHVHVLDDECRASPRRYLQTLRDQQIAVATLTPAYLALLNETPDLCREMLGGLRLLILGGEALQAEEVRRWQSHSPQVQLVNVYGPTETTVMSSACFIASPLETSRGVLPLGRPIANTEFWILDAQGRACPRGVTGRLHIGGAGLALGYWDDAERTAAAFGLHAPDGGAQRRLYDSGDLVRLAHDGALEFVGRADTQVKLRGFRIEPGEVEHALLACPGVQQAVVALRSSPSGEPALVAWWSGACGDAHVLARHAARRLPAYMLPSVYCHLAQWPLNAHRKVDRQRLPDPVWSAADGTSGVGSGDPWQASLASLWCEVLGVQQVTPDDQFPLLGGSSLGTARLAQRIRDRLGREVDMLALLQHPRLLDMARLVAASPPAPPEDAFAAPRTPVPRQALPAPASEAQARMVFLDRQHPGTALHNIPLTLRLAASPSVAALAAAAEALHHRHEQLRARLRDGQPMLMQESGAPAPGLEHHVAADEPSALAVLGEFQSRPYDIAQGPLWRVALVEKADTPAAAWLALSMHHAISDGVTLARMLEELDALQSGATLAPADTEPGFADYVAWQAEWLASAAGEAARRHWAGGTWQRPLPALPTTTTVTEVGTSVAGRQFVFDFDERITRGLAALALQQRVSPFALMLSLFGLVLGRRCGSQAMVLGVTLGGRSRSAFERAPGLFVNTLPMPFDWHGEERLSSLLQRTTRELSTLQSLQDYPLNRVVALQAGTSPPFNVLFNEEVLPHELRFGGQPAQLEGIGSGVAKLPLVLSFLLTGPAWRIRIEVRDGVCPPEWMAGLLADARRLAAHLEGMADAQLSELLAADGQLLALLEQG